MSAAGRRAQAALYGLAIGDALGMPTQSLPRSSITRRYGDLIDGFHPGPPDHPLAAGLPAGHVTDDTEQAVLLARLLVDSGGRVDARTLADRLLGWEATMRARGSLDLLGPSTKRAVSALAAGQDVDVSGRHGTTNGAAMRITPLGIACRADPELLVERVVEAGRATHDTGTAHAGAAAVAAAVSAGIDGAGTADAIGFAVAVAERAAGRGHWVAGADVAARIRWATALVTGTSPDAAAATIYTLVGTSLATAESVPAAFAVLAVAGDDPWLACRLAASLGGDTDTIAAMVGAVAGACGGEFPEHAVATVDAVNGLPLPDLARALWELRCSTG